MEEAFFADPAPGKMDAMATRWACVMSGPAEIDQLEEAVFADPAPGKIDAMATRMGIPCIGADFSLTSALQKNEAAEARPEDLPHFDAMQYCIGAQVEVWSNGRQCWLSAKVENIWLEDTVAEGFSVAAGTVKVTSEAGVKWIVPENVSVHLRKVASSAAAVTTGDSAASSSRAPAWGSATPERRSRPSSAASGSGRRAGSGCRARSLSCEPLFCKSNCGRPVQPGLTRSLKFYDTCCKRCAKHPGEDKHDANCGPARRLHVSGGASSDPGAHLICKRLLDSLLQDVALLAQQTSGVFKHFALDSSRGLGIAEVAEGVQMLLLGLFVFKLHINDEFLASIGRLHPGVDLLGPEQFMEVCRVCLEERQHIWFPAVLPVTTRNFVKKNNSPLEEVYIVGGKIGKGTFGEVYEVEHIQSGERRVCKRIMKSSRTTDYDQVLQEIGNMAMLDHPNVIKVYEYFDNELCVCQIIEQCEGGELQDQVDHYRRTGVMPYDEAFVCDVMKQTLRALAFMHKKPCMHKDLKPQNIMLVERGSSSIKVIDFGLAELFMPSQEFATSAGGTLLYMAPEVFRQAMTVKIDIWAVGVILYQLVTKDFPFMEVWPPPNGKDATWWQNSTIRLIEHAEPAKNDRLKNVSPECLDLLWQMLRKNVDERPDACQCLQHPWFQKFCEVPPPLSVGVVQCIEGYARMSELKKAIFLLIAHQSAPEAIEELRALFTHFDFRNQGSLSAADLHHVLIQSGMAGLRAERVIHGLDRDADGAISWTEFVAAAICGAICRIHKYTGVDAAFSAIDTDKDDKVSAEDIAQVLAGTDGELSAAWRKKCPSLLEDMLHTETSPTAGAMRAMWDMTTKLLGSGHFATKDQFRRYICQVMVFRPGDKFYAVS